jgi:5-carboxymethyl-2-hydroxymuconate isomerase
MPHLVILYTPQLDKETDMDVLCRSLANTMLAARDENGAAVFPPGGTRVLAFPAAHFAVADDGSAGRAVGGTGDYAFVYLQLRVADGRTSATHTHVGDALLQTTQTHFANIFGKRHIGITLQIDEVVPVYDGKHSNLHPLFTKA